MNKLKADGVFAREVNSSGIAFHSWYVAAAGPIFKEKVVGVCLEIILVFINLMISLCIMFRLFQTLKQDPLNGLVHLSQKKSGMNQ